MNAILAHVFIETWIDETEARTWFLFETCRAVEPEALSA
jgi:hypothetical protein